MIRPIAAASLAALSLAGCTTASLPPTQVVRYHLGDDIVRGTVSVQPAALITPGPEFQTWAAPVQDQLTRLGYTPAAPGALADIVAIVDFRSHTELAPPRRSPVSIGLGGGGYSGGYHGGVGLGGGVSFPVGGGGRRAVTIADLSVSLKRRADQTAVWEGHARGVTDARGPDATADAQARKLATAMFTGFPGQSGRTIEVK